MYTMDTLAHLPAGLDQFARAAQALCTTLNPNWRAYVTAGRGYAGPAEQQHFAISVFDHSTASFLRSCGELVHQTDHGLTTPEAALQALAAAYGQPWPPAPQPSVQAAKPMSQSQQEEIIRLLNHPKVARREKTLTLASLYKFDGARAQVCIGKIRQAIEDRETAPLAQAA